MLKNGTSNRHRVDKKFTSYQQDFTKNKEMFRPFNRDVTQRSSTIRHSTVVSDLLLDKRSGIGRGLRESSLPRASWTRCLRAKRIVNP